VRAALVATALIASAFGAAGCRAGDADPRPDAAAAEQRAEQARPPAARPDRAGPPAHAGAWVQRRTELRRRPGGPTVTAIGRLTRFDGPQVLAVVERRGRWLGVLHPRLPNGEVGWIDVADARLVREPWAVEVDLSARRALVRLHGEVVDRFRVAVGRPGATTPTGRFAVTDRIRTAPGSPYGCCILALSGRQPNLPQGWSGGDRLALHGTTNEATIGGAVSTGCLRVGEQPLRRLFRRLPVGARVTIRA